MDLDTFTAGLEAYFLRLDIINKEIGWPGGIYEENARYLFDQFVEIMEKQLKIFQSKKTELLKDCKEMEEEIMRWKKRIGGEIQREEDLQRTREVRLIEKFEKLKVEKEKIHEIYQNRLDIVQNLYLKLNSFRSTLGNFVSILSLKDEDTLPLSLDSIAELEKIYEKCHAEINIRRDYINSLISAIVNLRTELGIETKDELDESILQHYHATNDGRMIVENAGNIETLEMKKKKLEVQKQQFLSKISDIFSEINILWDKFSVTPIERNKFLEKNKGILSDILCEHETHLKMLHGIKIENCERHIQSAREKLILLWDALLFGEEERKAFSPAFVSNCTDESLAAHEAEIERLKRLLEELKPVLEVVNKHRRLTTELKEVEQSVKDPTRLIKRESGDHGLLREERIRKKLEKEAPKLENELESLLRRWEARHRKVFLVFGKRYLDSMGEYKKIRRENGIRASVTNRCSTSAVVDSNRSPLKSPPILHSSLVKSTTSHHFIKPSPAPGYSSPSRPSQKTQISLIPNILCEPSSKMLSPSSFTKCSNGSPKISATVPASKRSAQRNRTLVTKIPIAAPKTLNRAPNSQVNIIKSTISQCERGSNSFSGEPHNCVTDSQLLAARIEAEKVVTKEHHGPTNIDEQVFMVIDGNNKERLNGNAKELCQASTSTAQKNNNGRSTQRIAGSARKIKMLNSMPILPEALNHMNSELEMIEANKYSYMEYSKRVFKNLSLVNHRSPSPNSAVSAQSALKVIDMENSLPSIKIPSLVTDKGSDDEDSKF